MPASRLADAVHHLSRRLGIDEHSALPDGHLLTLFIEHRDADVLEVLVRRHGPMVLGVCRRLLGNQPDADDAFQATFLVLVRKAKSVRPRELVGNWLYGVARTTAVRARAARAKRQAREGRLMETPDPRAAEQPADDRLALLDVELSHLPEKYRVPIVLCDLGGKSHAEAAAHLGWPVGTLSGRLSRGRAMLAARLTRRGLPVGAVALATGVPGPLAAGTARLVSGYAAGGLVPVRLFALTQGVVKAMLMGKLNTAAAILAATACGAVGVASHPVAADQPAETVRPSTGGVVIARQPSQGDSGPAAPDAAKKELGFSQALAVHRADRNADPQRPLAPAAAMSSDIAWKSLGIRLRPVPADRVRHIDRLLRGGLEVVAVRPGSPADQAKLWPGDIIIGLRLWETLSPDHIAFVLRHPRVVEEGAVRCYVVRGDKRISVQLETAAPQPKDNRLS